MCEAPADNDDDDKAPAGSESLGETPAVTTNAEEEDSFAGSTDMSTSWCRRKNLSSKRLSEDIGPLVNGGDVDECDDSAMNAFCHVCSLNRDMLLSLGHHALAFADREGCLVIHMSRSRNILPSAEI